MTSPAQAGFDPDTTLTVLPGGLRLLVQHQPQRETLHMSVYLRAGSAHEESAWPGLAHVAEHMVFKGTRRYTAEQLNFTAERRGADVNAHTDKDHTAYHVRGLPEDAPMFIELLAELVTAPTFPADELARERQVLLQEFAEVEDDPVARAFTMMDRGVFGDHPLARPVIGLRRTLERFDADALRRHVQRLYSAPNAVVAVNGPLSADALAGPVAQAFAALPMAEPNRLPPPRRATGGLKLRPQSGSSQTHAVLGLPVAGLGADDDATTMAASVLGDGMSSPLLTELRERRGLAYQVSASTERLDGGGQFVIDASMADEHVEEAVDTVLGLLRSHAASIEPDSLARAGQQWLVHQLLQRDKPGRRLETAAVETLVCGRPRAWQDRRASMMALSPAEVAAAFGRLLRQPMSLAFTGRIPRTLRPRIEAVLQRHGVGSGAAEVAN